MDNNERLPEPVYYVSSEDDNTVLIAMNVAIQYINSTDNKKAVVTWYDTNRVRVMEADVWKFIEDGFIFNRSDVKKPQVYRFVPMTLEIYHNKVKARIYTQHDFSNKEDMIKAFIATLEYS